MSHLMTKPTKWVRPAKAQISLGIRHAWSEPLLSAWRNPGSLATNWAHIEDSDQTGRMPRLIWASLGAHSFCWFCHVVAHTTSICFLAVRRYACVIMHFPAIMRYACVIMHFLAIKQYACVIMHFLAIKRYADVIMHFLAIKQYACVIMHFLAIKQYACVIMHFLAIKQYACVITHGGSAVTFCFTNPIFIFIANTYNWVIRQAENDLDAGQYVFAGLSSWRHYLINVRQKINAESTPHFLSRIRMTCTFIVSNVIFIVHLFEPGHEKMCLMSYANNKGADQHAHSRSQISAFVVRCLDSIISLDSIAEFSRL